MFEVILKPNFNKLVSFLSINSKTLAELNKRDGIRAYLEYQSEESYNDFSSRLESICFKYGLTDHYNELLYLTMKKNEQIRERYNAYWQNYHDDLDTKEFVQFLCTYKEASEREHLSLSIKPQLGSTVTIKNNQITRWICQLISDNIEKGEFPLDVFGEKMIYNIFGNEGFDQPLSIARLKEVGSKTPRRPTVRLNKLYVELCMYLQPFLNEHTSISLEEGKMLNDAQANFFFEILEALKYMNSLKIESDPKDYIWALFNNTIKSYKSKQ